MQLYKPLWTVQVSNAAMMSMTGRILSEKIDVLRLTFYTAPVSCALLLPVFFIREVRPCEAQACSWRSTVCGHCSTAMRTGRRHS